MVEVLPQTPGPDDEVRGGDPTFDVTVLTGVAFVVRCPCGWEDAYLQAEKAIAEAEQHHRFGHPAWRNPDLTCQAHPRWDSERWCVRAKGHEGRHWTPNFKGGMWWDAQP